MKRRALLGAAASAPAAGLAGCSFLGGPSRVVMDQLYDDRACPATLAPVLLVLLPGAHMAPAEMQREGFVAAVRQRRLAVDVSIADAHLGYVHDGSVMQHLHADVIAPARAAGYRRIWLGGISLGGYLALHYARLHPGQIEGLTLLAPYLGARSLFDTMAAAGGPQAWRQNTTAPQPEQPDDALWRWLLDPAALHPPTWLGFGREDRFAEAHHLLAGLLPAERVHTLPGGHDWAPWRALWSQWLDRGLLPGACIA
jgi:pimeloyl-ACP methyl ester carboxylesterase